MPVTSLFSITSSPEGDVVVGDPSRSGTFTLNVKNEGAAADRVVVEIDADSTAPPAGDASAPGTADPSWFTITNKLRPLPAGAQDQFPVAVAVPRSIPAGSYTFAPVAYSADRPPEDTKVRGPRTMLVVPSPVVGPVAPWYRRWWPWWLVVAIAAVVLIVAVIVVILILRDNGGEPTPTPNPTPIAVPDVVGRDRTEAEQVLLQVGLNVSIQTQPGSCHFPANLVIDQKPPAGTEMAAGETVIITILGRPPLDCGPFD